MQKIRNHTVSISNFCDYSQKRFHRAPLSRTGRGTQVVTRNALTQMVCENMINPNDPNKNYEISLSNNWIVIGEWIKSDQLKRIKIEFKAVGYDWLWDIHKAICTFCISLSPIRLRWWREMKCQTNEMFVSG